ncbi:MAG: hypothetical protein ACE5FU_01720 [Nitrospinota bacterium]
MPLRVQVDQEGSATGTAKIGPEGYANRGFSSSTFVICYADYFQFFAPTRYRFYMTLRSLNSRREGSGEPPSILKKEAFFVKEN